MVGVSKIDASSNRSSASAATSPPDDGVRWGLGDAAAAFVGAYLVAGLLAPLAYAITGQPFDTPSDKVPLSTLSLQQIPYVGTMLLAALFISWRKGRGPVVDYGLRVRWTDAPLGLALGTFAQYAAVVVYLPLFWFDIISTDDLEKPARELTDRATGAGVVLLVILVVIVPPIVEEIFFRGLLLRSLERRFGTTWAIVGSAALFGAAHFEKLQFPALFLFGLLAAVLTTRTGRLGPSMFAHLAFNAVTVVALLH